MAQQWFVRRGDQEDGPITTQTLKEAAASGDVLPTDLVRTTTSRNWHRAARVKGLFGETDACTTPPATRPDDVVQPVEAQKSTPTPKIKSLESEPTSSSEALSPSEPSTTKTDVETTSTTGSIADGKTSDPQPTLDYFRPRSASAPQWRPAAKAAGRAIAVAGQKLIAATSKLRAHVASSPWPPPKHVADRWLGIAGGGFIGLAMSYFLGGPVSMFLLGGIVGLLSVMLEQHNVAQGGSLPPTVDKRAERHAGLVFGVLLLAYFFNIAGGGFWGATSGAYKKGYEFGKESRTSVEAFKMKTGTPGRVVESDLEGWDPELWELRDGVPLPFPKGTSERKDWLRGFSDGLRGK